MYFILTIFFVKSLQINLISQSDQQQHKHKHRFEALEYAGILEEARSTKEGDEIIAKTRDYLLRSADGMRQDIRNNLNPKAIKKALDRNMKRDKHGTTGFGAGAFLGLVL
jgi:hypothetical protein